MGPHIMILKPHVWLAVVLCLGALATMCPAQQAPSPAPDCATEIGTLLPCLPYVTGNASVPPPECCTALLSVVSTAPNCLCRLFNLSSMGIQVNMTAALQLPATCNVTSPDLSTCPAGTSPTPPSMSAPVPSPPSTGTPVPSPASPPTGTTSPTPTPTPTPILPPSPTSPAPSSELAPSAPPSLSSAPSPVTPASPSPSPSSPPPAPTSPSSSPSSSPPPSSPPPPTVPSGVAPAPSPPAPPPPSPNHGTPPAAASLGLSLLAVAMAFATF